MEESVVKPEDIYWSCMKFYFETAHDVGIISSKEHMNEPLHRILYGVTGYWINNYHLRNVFRDKPEEWSRVVNETCFECGLILAKELRDNPDGVEEKHCDIVSGTYTPSYDIDSVHLKCDLKKLYSVVVEINEIGMKVREQYPDSKKDYDYIFNTFFAVTQLGVAVFEENGV